MGPYLVGASYKPGPVLGTEDAAVNRKGQEPALQGHHGGTARQPGGGRCYEGRPREGADVGRMSAKAGRRHRSGA